jgi:hypothetical protein
MKGEDGRKILKWIVNKCRVRRRWEENIEMDRE